MGSGFKEGQVLLVRLLPGLDCSAAGYPEQQRNKEKEKNENKEKEKNENKKHKDKMHKNNKM